MEHRSYAKGMWDSHGLASAQRSCEGNAAQQAEGGAPPPQPEQDQMLGCQQHATPDACAAPGRVTPGLGISHDRAVRDASNGHRRDGSRLDAAGVQSRQHVLER